MQQRQTESEKAAAAVQEEEKNFAINSYMGAAKRQAQQVKLPDSP
jgi:hypothetical protein